MTVDASSTTEPEFRLQGLLFVHSAMRKGADRFVRSVSLGCPRENLSRWFSLYWRMVQTHHEAEDALIFPAILQRAPQHEEALAALGAEHQSLHLAAERVGQSLEKHEAEKWASAFEAFRQALRAHLDAEETRAIPLIARTLSVPEQDALGAQVRKSFASWRDSLLVPWIAERWESEDPSLPLAPFPRAQWLLHRGLLGAVADGFRSRPGGGR